MDKEDNKTPIINLRYKCPKRDLKNLLFTPVQTSRQSEGRSISSRDISTAETGYTNICFSTPSNSK